MKPAINYSGFEDLAALNRADDTSSGDGSPRLAMVTADAPRPSYEKQIEYLSRLRMFEPDY